MVGIQTRLTKQIKLKQVAIEELPLTFLNDIPFDSEGIMYRNALDETSCIPLPLGSCNLLTVWDMLTAISSDAKLERFHKMFINSRNNWNAVCYEVLMKKAKAYPSHPENRESSWQYREIIENTCEIKKR